MVDRGNHASRVSRTEARAQSPVAEQVTEGNGFPLKREGGLSGWLNADGAEDDKLCRDLALDPPEEAQGPGGGDSRHDCD